MMMMTARGTEKVCFTQDRLAQF